MNRHVLLEDQERPLIWVGDDLSRLPRITSADWKALLGLIAFAIVFIAWTAVGS